MAKKSFWRFWIFLICRIFVIGFLVILFGFFVFIHDILESKPPQILRKADAIVVLTGGRSRIPVGTQLLSRGYGQRLLISGVNGSFRYNYLRRYKRSSRFSHQIDLGYRAKNTRGNAIETSIWMKKQNYRSLILVTNNYHMPRSLLVFQKYLPDTKIIPYPVNGNYEQFYKENHIDWTWVRISFMEYIKYIGAYLLSKI